MSHLDEMWRSGGKLIGNGKNTRRAVAYHYLNAHLVTAHILLDNDRAGARGILGIRVRRLKLCKIINEGNAAATGIIRWLHYSREINVILYGVKLRPISYDVKPRVLDSAGRKGLNHLALIG